MKVHFYGTGSSEGFPSLFCECEACRQARITGGKNRRTRSSLLIDDCLMIDFSPDTFAHTIYGGLDLTKVEHLLLTHSHPDHLYSMDIANILPPMARVRQGRKLHVYGNRHVNQALQYTLRNCIHPENYISMKEIWAFHPLNLDGYEILPVRADHMPHEECLLYVICKSQKTLLIGFDTSIFPEDTWQALAPFSFDCVILDCTSVDQDAFFKGHMGFGENLKIKERMLNEGMAGENTRFIATHFAHSFSPLHERLTALFQPHGFLPAYDGMEINL